VTQRAAALAVLELNADVLLRGRLGFRTLLDVIPLDAGLVKGSHGRPVADRAGRRCCAGSFLGSSAFPLDLIARRRFLGSACVPRAVFGVPPNTFRPPFFESGHIRSAKPCFCSIRIATNCAAKACSTGKAAPS